MLSVLSATGHTEWIQMVLNAACDYIRYKLEQETGLVSDRFYSEFFLQTLHNVSVYLSL